jgi:uncharacterized NAD(P)/FAD-binding protein YdhS
MSRRTLVLCGDGASAVLLASALARQTGIGLRLVIVGRGPRIGRGIAYSTANHSHLLNVPAARMSGDVNRPEQFAQWLAARGVATEPWADSFAPRALYGEYLEEQFKAACDANPDLEVRMINAEVKSLIQKSPGWLVTAGRERIHADLVVLATGNDLTTPISQRHPASLRRHIHDNPWSEAEIDPNADVLVLGTGLTAVDVVMSLSDRGHHGHIHLLSRRGLLPQTHVKPEAMPALPRPFPATARGLARALRANADAAPAKWQGFMDAMRPHWPEIWQALPPQEKKRFLRHGFTQWNVHRHRLAPKVGTRLAQIPNLRIWKGRLQKLSAGKNGAMTASIMGRDIAADLPVHHVINCTGPNSDPEKAHDPFIENLIGSRLARGNSIGIGLAVDEKNRVLDFAGTPQPSLLAMAALTRGHWWEITAIPEIARQAQTLSGAVMAHLGVLNAASRVNKR